MTKGFLAGAISILAAAQAAAAADFSSLNGVPTACSNEWALDQIIERFSWAEETLWHRGFDIESIWNPRLSGHAFSESGMVKREYCVGDATMTGGEMHSVYYTIEDGLGFAGVGSYVDFCVLGLDPWHVHDGACRTVR